MSTNIEEFQKFLRLMPKTPVLIPIIANSKKPDIPKNESWKNPKYHLTPEQAITRLKQGRNIGVVATDWLVIVDLDNPQKYNLPIKTFTVETRNGRLHKYFINSGDVENADGKNTLAKCGEVRAEWQYVLTPGSYVPPDEDAVEGATGLYKIVDASPLATLHKSDLPAELLPTLAIHDVSVKSLTKPVTIRNKYGWTLNDIRAQDENLDQLLNNTNENYPSASEADMATLAKLLFWEFEENEAVDILKKYRTRNKLNRLDYIASTLAKISITNKISDSFNGNKWHPKKPPKLKINNKNSSKQKHQLWPEILEGPAECDEQLLEQELLTYVKQHVEFSAEQEYAVFIAFIKMTWIHPLFETTPYLFFYGPKRSGKTRALNILHKLCYKSIYGANFSTAAIYLAIEQYHPTLLLDETEIYRSRNREKSDETLHLLNSGYKRGQKVYRAQVNPQGEWHLKDYDVFCPKALAGTRGLLDTLEDRCIVFSMIKNRSRIARKIDKVKARELRGKLYTWQKQKLDGFDGFDGFRKGILDGLDTLYNTYSSCLEKDLEGFNREIDPRLFELFEPLYGGTWCGNPSNPSSPTIKTYDSRKQLIDYLLFLQHQREIEEETSLDAEIVNLIIGCSKDSKSRFSTSQIADLFNSSRKEKEQWKSSSVGYIVKRLGFKNARTSDGRRGWFYDEKLVERLKKRYNFNGFGGEHGQLAKDSNDQACGICLKPLPPDLSDVTVWQTKNVHISCYRKMKDSID